MRNLWEFWVPVQKYKLFIQSNKKQLLGAYVSRYTFLKHAKSLKFDVEILMAEDYPVLDRDGELHLREDRKVVWRSDLQSFTPTRFLPPQKMNFEGRAIVIDPDVFALTDCAELFQMDMQNKAILARKITEKNGHTYWASSVMLLDCTKLKHWSWERDVQEMFDFKRDYRQWISLHCEDQSTIGELSDEWNHYDILNASTKFLHNTGRITQPWKTGLPIDFAYSHKKLPQRKTWLQKIKKVLGQVEVYANMPIKGVYKPHPDPKQEKFFLQNLSDCIREGHISLDFVRSEIAAKNVRSDLLDLLGGAHEIRI